MPFVVGNSYTRKDIYEILAIPDAAQRGRWNTGYTEHNGEIYVFCNVGVPGRTGHDYENRWDGNELVWFGKTGSRLHQPFIQKMLSNSKILHFFWRDEQYSPFIYVGSPDYFRDAKDTSPIEVRWGFGNYETTQQISPSVGPSYRNNADVDDLSKALLRMASVVAQRISVSQQISTITRPLRTGPHFTHLISNLRALWEQQQGFCALCEKPIPISPTNRLLQMSSDRIDSQKKTYSLENIQIVHLGCNLAKSDVSLLDWREFLYVLRGSEPS